MAPFPSPTKQFHSSTYPSLSPTRYELSAKGKSILISGGGTGIGAETALYFAKAGASRLALLGRREQPLLDTKASIQKQFAFLDIFTASVDVTKKNEVDSAFAKFAGQGKIDVVVSNAATVGPRVHVNHVDAEELLEGVRVNLAGAVNVAQAFIRYAAKDAVGINVCSSAVHVHFSPDFASYSCGKIASFKLWDEIAHYNPQVRIYHLQPGVVATDMNRESGGVKATGIEDQANLPASFMVWLTSPEASFLRGKLLWANWDVDELKARAKELASSVELSIQLVGWPFGDPSWKPTWVET